MARTADTLERVDFDHVFTVSEDGTIADGPSGIYAPDVWHDDTTDIVIDSRESWRPMTGYTGQYGYHGAVMHPSEYIGGALERDILSDPGVYVVVVVEVLPNDDDSEPEPAGWAVLKLAETL